MVTCLDVLKLRCLKNRHSLVPSLAQQAAPRPLCASIKMHYSTVLSFLICLLGLIGSVRAADKYTDENRPYEFGFTIDGEQHRHEKKDENGIIMGEFGFITADGVYHVTVYATDENGRFKILSMKNIRVKPYPTAASTAASKTASTTASSGGVKKGHSIPFPPSGNSPAVQGPSTSKTAENSKNPQQGSKPLPITKLISSPAKSCSHCSIPTTTTKAPPLQLTDIAVVSKDRSILETSGLIPSNNYQQNTQLSSSGRQNNLSPQEVGKSFSSSYSGQQTNPPSIPSNNYQQNTQLSSSGRQNNLSPQEVGKSFSSSYSGQQTNPPSPEFSQNTPQYPQVNSQQNSFGNVQQNYQQQDLSRNINSPSGVSKEDYPQQNYNENSNNPQSNYYNPQNGNNANQNNFEKIGNESPQSYPPNGNSGDQYYNQEKGDVNKNYPPQEPNYVPVQPGSGQDSSVSIQSPNLRNPKQYNDISSSNVETGLSQGFRGALASQPYQPVSNRPTLVAAQMQIVPKDTDIYHRGPGEKEGLPSGISKDDMTHLLYTFNYTVGFHGHHEEGYSNGAKMGYYYITGRNGVRTRVDYIADEKGFRPTISQEVLDLLSDDVPKPETEKDEKFGLKGYEFKWIYYPTNERK